MSLLMPSLFIGHGNPMIALADNSVTRAWRSLGEDMPSPRAILAISAHWYIGSSAVTISTKPRTIHDFGGFPEELYRVEYPASGSAALAARVQKLLAPVPVEADERWGLDHGTWCVLRHLYPDASIPVVQLSINSHRPPTFHYELGKRLASLREEGILILGSGNVVHNLRAYQWQEQAPDPYPWATAFESRVRELISANQPAPLVEYETQLGPESQLAVPTPEHYLPLLYTLGTRARTDSHSFPVQGIDGGSVSMLALKLG